MTDLVNNGSVVATSPTMKHMGSAANTSSRRRCNLG